MNSLLPPNSTPQEYALDSATARIGDVPVKARTLWNSQECPAELLPWLAWALSIDEWNSNWSDAQKRGTVAASYQVHSTKGTPAAVKTSLGALGYSLGLTEWWQTPTELAPYTFAVDIDTGNAAISSRLFYEAIALINQSKNTRSHLARLRIATRAPVNFFAAAAQQYGIYCATGGTISVVGGRPKLLKANAMANASATANLTALVVRYFAATNSIGDVRLYRTDGISFTPLPNPDVEPGGSNLIYGADFSPNGDYLAVFANTAPRLFIYKRNGTAFTKLPDPAVVPVGGAGRAMFSPDGSFLACATNGGNDGLIVYERTGDTFTKLTGINPSVYQVGLGTAWSADGTYLAVATGGVQPFVFKRTGSSFVTIGVADPALPIAAQGMAFSPATDLLICVYASAPFISVSSISGVNHTLQATPTELPTLPTRAVSFNHDGSLVAVGSDSGLYLYAVSGVTLTRLSNPVGAPNSNIKSVSFNHDGTILIVGVSDAPYLFTYQVSGTTLTAISNPTSLPAYAIWGTDFT